VLRFTPTFAARSAPISVAVPQGHLTRVSDGRTATEDNAGNAKQPRKALVSRRFAPLHDGPSRLQKRQLRRTTKIAPRVSTTNPANARIATAISAIPIWILSTAKDCGQSKSMASTVSANAMSRSAGIDESFHD